MKMEAITMPENQQPSPQELSRLADIVEGVIKSHIHGEKLRDHVIEKIVAQIRRGITTIILTSVTYYGRFPKDLSKRIFEAVNAVLEEAEDPWRFRKNFGRSRSPMSYAIVPADKCRQLGFNDKESLIEKQIAKGPKITINPPLRKTGDHAWNAQASSDEGRFKELMRFEVVVIPAKSELYRLCKKDGTLLGMRKDPNFSVAVIVVSGPLSGRIMIIPRRLLKNSKTPKSKELPFPVIRPPEWRRYF